MQCNLSRPGDRLQPLVVPSTHCLESASIIYFYVLTWFPEIAFRLGAGHLCSNAWPPGPEGTQLEEAVFKPTPGLDGCGVISASDLVPSLYQLSSRVVFPSPFGH